MLKVYYDVKCVLVLVLCPLNGEDDVLLQPKASFVSHREGFMAASSQIRGEGEKQKKWQCFLGGSPTAVGTPQPAAGSIHGDV